ncbi:MULTISPECIES: HNH endonuclease [Bacillus]|uniref:HNH endonuclease n=1 Tax=Bacillus TaxID=1386 RepID=UPI000BBD1606|nr:HNH endonuclease [Bacillus paralicheniformis]MBU8580158.1 HNH endonuclease [Bacillus paralicheniformis]MBZ5215183.1 HNH endonuclease [Bacillus paralicheniformis]QEO05137.1 HNH endonuclease [Bacillus paralicheniformis]
MTLTEEVCSEVLAKCARVCCICKEFKPLHIQVHHIIEKSEGGTDDFDNLIPVCVECHSSIHTKSKMTQNFTKKEQKKARDTVYEMVSLGKLPKSRSFDRTEIELMSSIFAETLKNSKEEGDLSSESIKLLSTMLCERAPAIIKKINEENLLLIEIGGQYITQKCINKAQYSSSILELLSKGLVHSTGDIIKITDEGEKLISKLVQTTATYTQKKIKCLACGLHFIICTWNKHLHNSSTIICPECGQKKGDFIVWAQQKFGFIFQEVPGNAKIYDLRGHYMNNSLSKV